MSRVTKREKHTKWPVRLLAITNSYCTCAIVLVLHKITIRTTCILRSIPICVCHLLLVRAVPSLLCQKRSTSCSTSLALSTACCCKQHQRCMRKGTISKTSGKTDTLNSLKCKKKEYLVHPHQLSTTCSGKSYTAIMNTMR